MLIEREHRDTLDDDDDDDDNDLDNNCTKLHYILEYMMYALSVHMPQNDELIRFISGHSPPRGMVRVPSTSNRAIILGFAGAIFTIYWIY